MLDLNEIHLFTAVVEEGSFTGAARRLGVPKSRISRKVAALEERLGVRLLHRTTRSVTPTDAGRVYYEHASLGITAIENAERVAANVRESPKGLLKISAPSNSGNFRLCELVHGYLERYPDVEVMLFSTDRYVDLVAEGFDLAIRAGLLEDSSLRVARLWTLSGGIFASAAYLEEHGLPETPEDLKHHQAVLFGRRWPTTGVQWDLHRLDQTASVRMNGRVCSNDFEAVLELVAAGAGLAVLPALREVAPLTDAPLVRVLPDWSAGQFALNLVYPSARLLDPKTRAFVDMARAHFKSLAPN